MAAVCAPTDKMLQQRFLYASVADRRSRGWSGAVLRSTKPSLDAWRRCRQSPRWKPVVDASFDGHAVVVGAGAGAGAGAGPGAGLGALVERFDIEPFLDFSAK